MSRCFSITTVSECKKFKQIQLQQVAGPHHSTWIHRMTKCHLYFPTTSQNFGAKNRKLPPRQPPSHQNALCLWEVISPGKRAYTAAREIITETWSLWFNFNTLHQKWRHQQVNKSQNEILKELVKRRIEITSIAHYKYIYSTLLGLLNYLSSLLVWVLIYHFIPFDIVQIQGNFFNTAPNYAKLDYSLKGKFPCNMSSSHLVIAISV